jgi:hypothetical protein
VRERGVGRRRNSWVRLRLPVPLTCVALAALAMAAANCGGTLDAGADKETILPVDAAADKEAILPVDAAADRAAIVPLDAGADKEGLLPVDERNPIIIFNDNYQENWQGEYAILLANSGGPALVGIIVNTSPPSPNIDANLFGWNMMVKAARDSGLRNIPTPIRSVGPELVRPSDGNIDATVPNHSAGATFIVETSRQIIQQYNRPLVLVTGGRLTDVADAYLLDHTLPERVVVLSSLGTVTSSGAEMGMPNGEMDRWADIIVTKKFSYIQVSAYYDQLTDVTPSILSQLPDNPFTDWITSKQPNIWDDPPAADQVGVAAIAIPGFVSKVSRVTQKGLSSANNPTLIFDDAGANWLVTKSSGALATARFWQALLDPATFRP